MHPILLQIQSFLDKANKSPLIIPDEFIEEFGEQCKEILRKQFTKDRETKFRLRGSNVGRPLCQLQMEAKGAPAEPAPYNLKMQNTFGDLVEALAVFVLKASNVNIQGLQRKVALDIGGTTIEGALDIEIDSAIYDIKSVSSYSFDHKFGPDGGFKVLLDDDSFGYLGQGYTYAEADEKPFAGWIIVNKSTGEWHVLEVPPNTHEVKEAVLGKVDQNIRAIRSNEEFRREFTDVEEKFNKKLTGNRILPKPCEFCQFKKPCWGKLEFRPQLSSKSDNPRWYYYTHIAEDKKEEVTE